MKNQLVRLLAVLLLHVAAGAAEASVSPSLADRIARADSAYRSLPISLSAYNSAVLEICKELETVRLSELESSFEGWASHLVRPKWDFRFAMSKFLLRALTPVQLMPGRCEWWSG